MRWYSLTQAATLLGVHPTTLRRWADQGAIEVMVTPGGHRRFSAEALEKCLASAKRPTSADLALVERAVTHTRRGLQTNPQVAGIEAPAEVRTQLRELGQQLVGITINYMARDDEGQGVPEEASEIGRAYGKLGLSCGMPLTQMLDASLYFHGQLLESSMVADDGSQANPETNLRVLRRTNRLLRVVHIAIAEQYQATDLSQ